MIRALLFTTLLLLTGWSLSYGQTQVSFTTFDTLTLNGTLTLPQGPGTHPLVIMVHGSGPNDRDQTTPLVGGNSACLYPNLAGDTIYTLKDIGEALVAAGYGVLRYDKRTFTHGATLDQTTITTTDFARDAGAAIDFAKTQAGVDTGCIVLCGISQGSTLIPVTARNRTDVRGLISLAGPETPVDSLLADQVRYIYAQCADSAQGETIAQQYLSTFAQVRAGTWPANTPIQGAYPNFWADWINLGDSAVINYQAFGGDMLFIQGDEDINVPLEEVDAFENALPPAQTTVKRLTGINHFMTTMDSVAVDTAVTNTIIRWLDGLKQPMAINTPEASTSFPFSLLDKGDHLQVVVQDAEHHIEGLLLYNMAGQQVAEAAGDSISTAHLKAGQVYILQVNAADSVWRQQVVVR